MSNIDCYCEASACEENKCVCVCFHCGADAEQVGWTDDWSYDPSTSGKKVLNLWWNKDEEFLLCSTCLKKEEEEEEDTN
ncbi:MAG: hypothetical protein EBU66_16680 [Bacteroidetes bacterium]|nr:hypothetical protein [bacterium]NBP66273.1 hypothetical protein [Bacteroidota bacterium]